MSPIKQSFAWWCVQKHVEEPRAFFKAMKKIGFDGVELLPQDLWQIAVDEGLAIVSEGAGSLIRGLNHLEHHEEVIDEVSKKIELAIRYLIPNLIVFSGNRMGLEDKKGAENTITGLKHLAPLAESSGIQLILELLNSKVDHIDYMCDHTEWAAGVITEVDSPNIKILYDVYHMQIMEGDIIRTIRQHSHLFGHIHVAGNPGRRDLDSDQEINYGPIFRALKEADYTGYIGHEFMPKGDAVDAMRQAYELCISS